MTTSKKYIYIGREVRAAAYDITIYIPGCTRLGAIERYVSRIPYSSLHFIFTTLNINDENETVDQKW